MKINYDEIEMAMSFNALCGFGQHYLDKETGNVLLISDWVHDEARKFDDPDAIEGESIRLAWYLLWYGGGAGSEMLKVQENVMAQQVDNYLERFLAIPQVSSHESYQDMVDFTDTVANPDLRDFLSVALNGRGAFRRFKDVLYDYPDERERWFAFSARCWRKRIDAWLQVEGVSL